VDKLKETTGAVAIPDKTMQIQNDTNVEFTYPEYAENNNNNNFIQDGSGAQASTESLTRAKMAEMLAGVCKLRQAKVMAPPARDVGLNNPNVRAIKSAIVTGIIPNLAPQLFYPDKPATKQMAADALAKAGLAKPKLSAAEKDQIISEAEFDSWIKKRVK